MNQLHSNLLERAGFVLWSDEAWRPPGATVDWSCDYDLEVQQLIKLVVDECARTVDHINVHGSDTLGNLIRRKFDGQ